ncbi:MAG: hypothetical protein ACR2PL_10950 [Dehalococcoidia bacterium]
MQAIASYQQRGDGPSQARATLEALVLQTTPGLAVRLLAWLLDPMRTGRTAPSIEQKLRRRLERLLARHTRQGVAAPLTFADGNRALHSSDLGTAEEGFRIAAIGMMAEGQTNLAAEAGFRSGWIQLVMGRPGEVQAAMDAVLTLAGRLHLRWTEETAAYHLAGLRLVRGDVTGFARYGAAYRLEKNCGWRNLTALRLLQVGELERALTALPDPGGAVSGTGAGEAGTSQRVASLITLDVA